MGDGKCQAKTFPGKLAIPQPPSDARGSREKLSREAGLSCSTLAPNNLATQDFKKLCSPPSFGNNHLCPCTVKLGPKVLLFKSDGYGAVRRGGGGLQRGRLSLEAFKGTTEQEQFLVRLGQPIPPLQNCLQQQPPASLPLSPPPYRFCLWNRASWQLEDVWASTPEIPNQHGNGNRPYCGITCILPNWGMWLGQE